MTRSILVALPFAALALVAADDAPKGYLPPHAVDLVAVLPPAPAKGDIRYETDRRIFKAMKARIGSPRWTLATSDADYATPAMMRDFACATGIALSPEATPATYRLLTMASVDTGRANDDAKERYRRLRPYHIDPGETCQAKSELGDSFDYPSGHTTKGWTFGLVLADALPGRATPILARARAYGESRIVCRVHNFSAVENGRLGATVAMEAIRATPGYRRDLAVARAELANLHGEAPGPDPQTCAAEAALTGPSVMSGLRR